ncbi:MAG: hypothetical protein NTU88_05620, partial [Armatimonadetes bacterium]|nr:hypothetical protein [Armatimonadota bacterium]
MAKAPREVWRISTGGDVGCVRPVSVGGKDAALIQVGTGLQLTRWTGDTVWRDFSTGVGQVLHVGDFD